jgi:hypothetical protein
MPEEFPSTVSTNVFDHSTHLISPVGIYFSARIRQNIANYSLNQKQHNAEKTNPNSCNDRIYRLFDRFGFGSNIEEECVCGRGYRDVPA